MKTLRHVLSMLAGVKELMTRKFFKGVFSIETLPLADNLVDLNKPNLFFVQCDNYFVIIFNTSTKCFVLDGVNGQNYALEIQRFVEKLSAGVPLVTLPYKMIDRHSSMIFCLLFAVALSSSTHVSVAQIVAKFGFKKNRIAQNRVIVNSWFNERYHVK